MKRPLVSILIPCYNSEAYIGEAIESALGQTYPNVEVVVIDDGSTDRSIEVIRSFGQRIRWEAGPNRGACEARNRALAISRGEYLQFLDADDRLHPEKIERQALPLLRDEADLIVCKGNLIRKNGLVGPIKREVRSPEGRDAFEYCVNQGLSTEGPLHRRKMVELVGGFRSGVPRAQEFDFHVRLGAAGVRIKLLSDRLYDHRDHDGPRITRTRNEPGYMTKLLVELADVLGQGSVYQMTPERRRVLAGVIHQSAIHSFRNGAREQACRGFRRARLLSNHFEYSERSWYKWLSRCIGPVFAERSLEMARVIRNSTVRRMYKNGSSASQ